MHTASAVHMVGMDTIERRLVTVETITITELLEAATT